MPLQPETFLFSPDTTLEDAATTALLLTAALEDGPPATLQPLLYTVGGWATIMTTQN